MSSGNLNLSGRPFVNGRPVTRAALLLMLFGGLLLLGNLFVYFSYVQGTGEKRAKLAQVEQQKEKEQRQIAQLKDRFATLDLDRQNEQVDFLNEKIAERTFSWSLLFDRLSKLMPADVRLTRLSPRGIVDPEIDRRRHGAPPVRKKLQEDRVSLAIGGEAKSDQDLLRFVDNLFADPSFIDPNLTQQTRETGKDVIRFDLRVDYLPRSAGRPAGLAPAPREPRAARGPKAAGQLASRAPRRIDSPIPGLRERPPAAPGAVGNSPAPPGVGIPGVGVPGVGVPRPPATTGGKGGRER